MEKSVVALVPCENYREDTVSGAVKKGIDLLGGIEKFFGRDEKILLKPNLLTKAEPDKAVSTHPAVFSAVGKLLLNSGYSHISFGDSPGPGSFSVSKVAEGCGVLGPAQEMNIPLADFTHGKQVPAPNGLICKSFTIANGVLDADAIINLCKMKTHALERITGAVKNIYGCVQGHQKTVGHAKYPDAIRFARMIADLNKVIKPRLHIMDGVVAMEGNGPSSGTPVPMKVLLFSFDPVALDSVFCRLVNMPPALVPTNVAGEQAGVGTWREDKITILTPDGEISFEKAAKLYGKKDFDVYRGSASKGYMMMLGRLFPAMRERPVADPSRCIKCNACVKSCPVEGKAIFLDIKKDQAPRYDYRKCIRCYCCQEMCPAKAISVKKPMGR